MPKTPRSSTGGGLARLKDSATPKASPKLYAHFIPVPILLPCPIAIPSSSSKPLTQVTHTIYCRPHHAKSSTPEPSTDGRTVFAVNLPVDMTERNLRTVFGKFGVVENVVFISSSSGDVLEQTVLGLSPDFEEFDTDEEDENDDRGAETLDGETEGTTRPEPRFISNLTRAERKRRRKPPALPDLTSLPSLCPRQAPYGASGFHSAHITFLDSTPIARIMSSTWGPIPLPQYGTELSNPSGMAYYLHQHSALRPDMGLIKEHADTYMARFDILHSTLLASKAREQGAGALVDEDGFTVVVRGGRYGRTGGRGGGEGALGVGVAKKGFGKEGAGSEVRKKKGMGGAGELVDFYKFQTVDRKRQDLADLRQQFEVDKQKVEDMKKSRRFRPY